MIREGPLAYQFFIGHDVTSGDGEIVCHPFTYDELLAIEETGARAVFKALSFLTDVP